MMELQPHEIPIFNLGPSTGNATRAVDRAWPKIQRSAEFMAGMIAKGNHHDREELLAHGQEVLWLLDPSRFNLENPAAVNFLKRIVVRQIAQHGGIKVDPANVPADELLEEERLEHDRLPELETAAMLSAFVNSQSSEPSAAEELESSTEEVYNDESRLVPYDDGTGETAEESEEG